MCGCLVMIDYVSKLGETVVLFLDFSDDIGRDGATNSNLMDDWWNAMGTTARKE